MKALSRAINAALRMGRDEPAVPESDLDALTDLAEVVEVIDKQVAVPLDDIQLKQAARELPDLDYAILCAQKAGMRREEIARKLGLDEIAVLRSLARTYSGFRVRAMG